VITRSRKPETPPPDDESRTTSVVGYRMAYTMETRHSPATFCFSHLISNACAPLVAILFSYLTTP
jgi:hypothetical protein